MKIVNAILYQFRTISLSWWIVIGSVATLLLLFRHKREQIIEDLLIIYILTVLASTVLSRSQIIGYSTEDLVNWNLVGTWIERITGDYAHKSELLLNFCMLLPVGVLFPWATKKGYVTTGVVGFSIIILIEFAQLITLRGWFELSDIVDNTIGVMIGYAIYRIGTAIWRKNKC